ncbi:MAG: fused MFS/spermidine synthase [Candidatus Omnitrophica bacterium]|nr:fused MFS/spermidine synthase [Candidatus Omnitrophota bacterium]
MSIFVILVVGFSGLIAQVLLLRELLISFYGNELTIGVILANWVFLEAAGAFIFGKVVDRIKDRILAFTILEIIFLAGFITSIYFVRTFKNILNFSPGLGVGINTIFWVSFLVFLLVAFPHGGLFSVCTRLFARKNLLPGSLVGRIYFWETIGTIIGGVIFTYFFIPYLDSFKIAFFVIAFNLIALYVLRGVHKAWRFYFGLSIIALAFLYLPCTRHLHYSSISQQLRNQEVLDYTNSIYGNVIVTKKNNQYTFFLNGIPQITIPVPDVIFIEEFAQLSLLFHPQPKDILILSGGAGGLINEILKNQDIESIDYVELDPLILKFLFQYSTDLTRRELSDPRVKIINSDGRLFIKKTKKRYDVIFLGLGTPSELQTNRLYTMEFFRKIKERLNKEGVFSLHLPGSLSYLGKELKDLNSCILNSLRDVFSYVRVIPGDSNLFLASKSSVILSLNYDLISQRCRARQLKTNLLLPAYLQYRFNPHWSNWFQGAIKDATKKTNQDFSCFAVFTTLSLWNAQFSPQIQGVFLSLEKVNLGLVLLFVFFVFFVFLIFSKARKFRLAVPYAIGTSGFFGMFAGLIIIFSFQIVHGYLFHQIGMLIAIFMGGSAAGSILVSYYLEKIRQPLRLLLALESAIILWIFATPALILSYPPVFIFFIICFISGFWVGAEFPLANKIYLKTWTQLGSTAGFLYGLDLIGGWSCALLGGILFLPILGLINTCIVISFLKLTSLVFLVFERQNCPTA